MSRELQGKLGGTPFSSASAARCRLEGTQGMPCGFLAFTAICACVDRVTILALRVGLLCVWRRENLEWKDVCDNSRFCAMEKICGVGADGMFVFAASVQPPVVLVLRKHAVGTMVKAARSIAHREFSR